MRMPNVLSIVVVMVCVSLASFADASKYEEPIVVAQQGESISSEKDLKEFTTALLKQINDALTTIESRINDGSKSTKTAK